MTTHTPEERKALTAARDATKAIERLADAAERAELGAGAIRVRDRERRWDETVGGLGELLGPNG
jgi:hypothetical protein